MPKIFITYRRDDTAAIVGRVYDRLVAHFGGSHVFMDIDNVPIGANFLEVIQESILRADVILVVIGRNWTAVGEDERRRIDAPDDFVRIEVTKALESGKPVIPVLVNGAEMPGAERLPTSLQPLTLRNAVEITHSRFHYDANKLIEGIEALHRKFSSESTRSSAESKRPEDVKYRRTLNVRTEKPKWQLMILGTLAIGALGLVTYAAERPSIEMRMEVQGISDCDRLWPDHVQDLNKFVNRLKQIGQITAIFITGHTDRLGNFTPGNTTEQKLEHSVKCAKVVADYLVSLGVDKDVIRPSGVADTQPIPVTKFCDEKMKPKQAIECLAPNRRVTVTALGVGRLRFRLGQIVWPAEIPEL